MRLRPLLLALGAALAFGLLPQVVRAQRTETELSRLPLTPRFAGLGDASAALVGYAGSVFSNPSGLAGVHVMTLEGAFSKVSDSSAYFLGAAAVRLGPVNLGGGLRYLRYTPGGRHYTDLESTVALVTRVKGVALGVGGVYYAAEDTNGTLTRDLTSNTSVTVAFFEIAALALSAQNVGHWSLEGPGLDLPSIISLGFSLNLIDTYSNGRLLATVERSWSNGDGQTLVGLEGGVVFYGVGIVARVGTRTGEPQPGFTRGGFGGSLVFGRAAVDYAYRERKAKGPLHLFGLRFTL